MVTQLGAKADPTRDRITVDGRPIRREPLVYFLLHKPVGVVTTLSDPKGRPTVRDLLGKVPARVFPVGRLDYNSSGLLLLTNDGELALRLTHPRYGVHKTYRVKVTGVPSEQALERLRSGVRLEEGKTAPAEVRIVEKTDKKSWLEIVLAEGKRHQVRRMCEAVGHRVEKLVRVRIGPLKLGNLAPGQYRPLEESEVAGLKVAVGLRQGGAQGDGARHGRRRTERRKEGAPDRRTSARREG